MQSTGTITRELVPKTEHEANAILDMTKQIMIHQGWSFEAAYGQSKRYYEYREKEFNELTGKK